MTTRAKGSVLNAVDLLNTVSTADMGPQNTDITAKIIAAFQAGYSILVPIGTWIISPITVPNSRSIYGFGINSVLKLKDGANAPAITLTDNCELTNFQINGNKDNQATGGCHGVDLYNSNQVKLDSILVSNTRGSGFYSNAGANEFRINNCKAQGFTESGFKFVNAIYGVLNLVSAIDSDAGAVGDGIAITSEGNTVSNIIINTAIVNNIIGRGIAVTGSGAKNALDVVINTPLINTVNSHGILLMTTATVIITNGIVRDCMGDGIRLEGDVTNCRVSLINSRNNSGSGIREVINGATPNNNGFVYNVLTANGNNVVTTVGANSFVV